MSNEKDPSRLYLGLDLSTQQLKAVVINDQLQTIAEADESLKLRNFSAPSIQKPVSPPYADHSETGILVHHSFGNLHDNTPNRNH